MLRVGRAVPTRRSRPAGHGGGECPGPDGHWPHGTPVQGGGSSRLRVPRLRSWSAGSDSGPERQARDKTTGRRGVGCLRWARGCHRSGESDRGPRLASAPSCRRPGRPEAAANLGPGGLARKQRGHSASPVLAQDLSQWSPKPRRSGHQKVAHGIEVLNALAGPHDHALEGRIDQVDRQAGLLREPPVEALQHAAATDQVEALAQQVL